MGLNPTLDTDFIPEEFYDVHQPIPLGILAQTGELGLSWRRLFQLAVSFALSPLTLKRKCGPVEGRLPTTLFHE